MELVICAWIVRKNNNDEATGPRIQPCRSLAVWIQYTNVTYKRTDGGTPTYSIARYKQF